MDDEPDRAGRLPVLILGGTTEASALTRALAAEPRLALTLSLAGRTLKPAISTVPTRIGGFGAYVTLVLFSAHAEARSPFTSVRSWMARIDMPHGRCSDATAPDRIVKTATPLPFSARS